MKYILAVFWVLGTVFCANSQIRSLEISNKSKNTIVDYTVEIPLESFPLSFESYIVDVDGQKVPLELSADLKGEKKIIFPLALIQSGENKKVAIAPGDIQAYPKRTYAELSHKIGGTFEGNKYVGGYSWVKPNYMKVSGDFKDHAYYIKYEGPGWESDKVAFRFYLDQRNAMDVFAKKTSGIVLPQVGIDGYDNYHKMADWGMDQMQVGKTLGIGSIAYWDGQKAIRVEKRDSVICFVAADGKIRSQVNTTYYGWNINNKKYDLKSLISIDAGSRASHMELLVDKGLDNLATGIIKNNKAEFWTNKDSGSEWTYIATFGKQSLNNDIQGLAVFARTRQIKEITSDDLSHVVVLNPENGYVDYYFMPTWELDWEPVITKDDFQRCIDEVLARLNNPCDVNIIPAKKRTK